MGKKKTPSNQRREAARAPMLLAKAMGMPWPLPPWRRAALIHNLGFRVYPVNLKYDFRVSYKNPGSRLVSRKKICRLPQTDL
jgi:hypothetical protein